MSDISKLSVLVSNPESEEENLFDKEEAEYAIGNIETDFEPYQDELLASSSEEEGHDKGEDSNEDGISHKDLLRRFEGREPVNSWQVICVVTLKIASIMFFI